MSDPAVHPATPQPNRYGPITVWEMFERTAAMLGENPKQFFGVVVAFFLAEIVASGVLFGIKLWISQAAVPLAVPRRVVFVLASFCLAAVLVFLFSQFVQGVLFFATQARLAAIPMSAVEAWRLAAHRSERLIETVIAVAGRIFVYILLMYGCIAILLSFVLRITGLQIIGKFLSPIAPGPGPIYLFLVVGVPLLVLAAAVLLSLCLFPRYALAIPAALAEDITATGAIQRSIDLGRGSKGRLYALYFGGFCAFLVVAVLTVGVQFLVTPHGSHLGESSPSSESVTMALRILRDLWGAVVVAIIGVGTSLCYYDLRVRKEGFDGTVPTPTPELPSAPPAESGDWPIEDLPIP